MNARRRNTNLGLPNRVYVRGASFYWVRPSDKQWVRLCRVDEGQRRMLARLAAEIGDFEAHAGKGDMAPLISEYVRLHKGQHKEKAWPAYGKYAGEAFGDAFVVQIAPADVATFLRDTWAGKLHMQRVMRSFMSGFFDWCISKRLIAVNPCREVKLKKPKPRTVYIPDAHFHAIRAKLLSYVRKTKAGQEIVTKVPAGDMMQVAVDLCYLTMQRSTDIRLLRWKPDQAVGGASWVDWDAKVIHFVPTKTEDSTGEAVDWPITPEIEKVLRRAQAIGKVKSSMYVIHSMEGQPYEANALLTAWKRAAKRAGLLDQKYTIKDIRAKAMTDAERAGYSLEQIQVGGTHADPKTTEIYLKARTVPVSEVLLSLPKAS